MGRNHEAAQGREGFYGWKQDGEGFCVGCSFLPLYVQSITSPIGVCGLLRAAFGQGEERHTPARRRGASRDDCQLLTITAIFYIVGLSQ